MREIRVNTLRSSKRSFHKFKHVERATFNLCHAPLQLRLYLGTQYIRIKEFYLVIQG
jgi:hypothetical protein